jgi:heat shock protein HslJ
VTLAALTLGGAVAWSILGDDTDRVVPASSRTTTTTGTQVTAGALKGQWALLSMTGYNGSLTSPPLGRAPFLSFDNPIQWFGSDGCNSVTGDYRIGSRGAFHMSIGGTLVGCAPADKFWKTIETAARVEINEDQLTLLDAGGRDLARFSH